MVYFIFELFLSRLTTDKFQDPEILSFGYHDHDNAYLPVGLNLTQRQCLLLKHLNSRLYSEKPRIQWPWKISRYPPKSHPFNGQLPFWISGSPWNSLACKRCFFFACYRLETLGNSERNVCCHSHTSKILILFQIQTAIDSNFLKHLSLAMMAKQTK